MTTQQYSIKPVLYQYSINRQRGKAIQIPNSNSPQQTLSWLWSLNVVYGCQSCRLFWCNMCWHLSISRGLNFRFSKLCIQKWQTLLTWQAISLKGKSKQQLLRKATVYNSYLYCVSVFLHTHLQIIFHHWRESSIEPLMSHRVFKVRLVHISYTIIKGTFLTKLCTTVYKQKTNILFVGDCERLVNWTQPRW